MVSQLQYRQDLTEWIARAADWISRIPDYQYIVLDVSQIQAVLDDLKQDQILFDRLVDYGLRIKGPPFHLGSMLPEMERLSGVDVLGCAKCGQRHVEQERLAAFVTFDWVYRENQLAHATETWVAGLKKWKRYRWRPEGLPTV